MSQVSEYVAAQTAHMDRQDKAIDGIIADFAAMKKDIARLNATQGVLTDEDEALLKSITARSEAVSTKLETLDNETAPPPPVFTEPDPLNPTNPTVPPEVQAERSRAQAAPSQGTPGSVQPTQPGAVGVNPGGTGTLAPGQAQVAPSGQPAVPASRGHSAQTGESAGRVGQSNEGDNVQTRADASRAPATPPPTAREGTQSSQSHVQSAESGSKSGQSGQSGKSGHK